MVSLLYTPWWILTPIGSAASTSDNFPIPGVGQKPFGQPNAAAHRVGPRHGLATGKFFRMTIPILTLWGPLMITPILKRDQRLSRYTCC